MKEFFYMTDGEVKWRRDSQSMSQKRQENASWKASGLKVSEWTMWSRRAKARTATGKSAF